MEQDIKQEFESLTKIIKNSFDGLEDEIGEIHQKLEENAREHRIMHQKLEDIELRLGNVAYAFDVRELEKRIIRMEKKLGLET